MVHKAGFVNIIGNPNVGKSTLMNSIIKEKLSIITSKAQTTRHRILGIVNGDDFQIIYSDTPGILKPYYLLHESMMKFVNTAISDADVILFMTDIFENDIDAEISNRLNKTPVPKIFIINKIDLLKKETIEEKIKFWEEKIKNAEIVAVSALKEKNTDSLIEKIISKLPEHPPYFPKDELTDKPTRFFVSEIIREKIFNNYQKEIPYSCEVIIDEFKEKDTLTKIRAIILVERDSQKGILIGHKGDALKKVGTEARKDIEDFIGRHIFLELFVKVSKDWRSDKNKLDRFGYNV
ncbi:MAG: GTPase Era [Bacteroidales bacterium]|nr:GTPase Era [Bacteroidales bacterium]